MADGGDEVRLNVATDADGGAGESAEESSREVRDTSSKDIDCIKNPCCRRIFVFFAFVVCLAVTGGAIAGVLIVLPLVSPVPNAELRQLRAQFADTYVNASLAALSAGDLRALRHVLRAARSMDELYLLQVWSGNVAMRERLVEQSVPATPGEPTVENERARLELQLFDIFYGPWNRLANNAPFVRGAPARPLGGNFYPSNFSLATYNDWFRTLDAAQRDAAQSYFTLLRQLTEDANEIITVPYSLAYRRTLLEVAEHLEAAANATTSESLREYLELVSASLLSNNYNASDAAWVALESPLEVLIGPYETYDDRLLGYKASFEAVVGVRDEHATALASAFMGQLQLLEDNLPMDAQYRNPSLPSSASIVVVNQLYAGGSVAAGVTTAAFNLPNDAYEVALFGSKRVMLYNIDQAKFTKVLVPIANLVIDPSQRAQVDFGAFFNHILAHELMHGLGPHKIVVAGQPTTVRLALGDLYSAIEEAKADICGVWALQFLLNRNVAFLPANLQNTLYVTYLASSIRSVRFGVTEAHARGQALQYNYLKSMNAIVYNAQTKTVRVNMATMAGAVESLARALLTIEATGNRAAAQQLLDQHAVLGADLQQLVGVVGAAGVPVDIHPIYTTASTLLAPAV